MEELKKIDRVIEREYPDAYRETLVVLDGTTGQNALAQAKEFNEAAKIDGGGKIACFFKKVETHLQIVRDSESPDNLKVSFYFLPL